MYHEKVPLILAMSLILPLHAMEQEKKWSQLLKEYEEIIDNLPIIKKQYKAHLDNDVPSPTDIRLAEIPVEECGEGLFDFRKHPEKRVYMMPDPSYPAEGPEFNSGLPRNSQLRAAAAMRLQQMVGFLDYFAPHFGYEPKQIDIQVCDALRSENVQVFLFGLLMQKTAAEHPALSDAEVYTNVSKIAAPPGQPYIHPSGAAVDIRLWNTKTKEFLDMGEFGAPWAKDPSTFPTFAENITEKQKRNRLYSLVAATHTGLVNYPGEWWHVSYGDCMHAYWTEENSKKRVVVYDLVEQDELEVSIDNNGHFKVVTK